MGFAALNPSYALRTAAFRRSSANWISLQTADLGHLAYRLETECRRLNSPNHHWSVNDDIVTFYLYRHGDALLPLKQAKIAERLDIGRGSLDMRKRNFAFLDGRGRLRNAANQTQEVRERYGRLTEPALRALVVRALDA